MQENTGDTKDGTASVLMHIFFSPSKAFLQVEGRGFILIPVVILSLVLLATSLITQPIASRDNARLIENSRRMSEIMTEEQIEGVRNPSTFHMMLGSIARPVLTVIGLLAYAFLLLIIAILAGCELTYGKIFTAVLLSSMIDPVLSSIIRTPLILAKETSLGISTSLSLLLPDAPVTSLANMLLSSLDLFSIWSLVVLIVGISAFAGIRTSKAAVIVSAGWILKNGVLIVLSLMTQKMTGIA